MTERLERDCVVAGGGPAGVVLGYLLARAGRRVTVLEKHGDFLRDFRGDTIHPSTVTLLGELGLRERFLALPLTRLSRMDVVVDDQRLGFVDFGTLRGEDDFLVLAPQWDFLDFLAREAAVHPGFELRMGTEATDLLREDGRVVGVRATGPDGPLEVRAPLTVAADGRSSVLRDAAGLVPTAVGVPVDVLWFGLPKPPDPPPATLAHLSSRGMVLTIDRGEAYQAGVVVPKGGVDQLRADGIAALAQRIASAAPVLAPVVGTLRSWDQVKHLSVQVDRLERWHRPGFVAIGDAAHAMSPMFGVGVNYAVQDAVALARAVAEPLAAGAVPEAVLAAVQRRRERPVRVVQRVQQVGHSRVARAATGRRVAPRAALRVLRVASPLVRRGLARFVGVGLRPEHVVPA